MSRRNGRTPLISATTSSTPPRRSSASWIGRSTRSSSPSCPASRIQEPVRLGRGRSRCCGSPSPIWVRPAPNRLSRHPHPQEIRQRRQPTRRPLVPVGRARRGVSGGPSRHRHLCPHLGLPLCPYLGRRLSGTRNEPARAAAPPPPGDHPATGGWPGGDI